MSDLETDGPLIDRVVRTTQIIVLAMAAGLLTFLAIVSTLDLSERQAPGQALPVITVAAFTFAAIFVPLSLVVPGLFSDAARKRIAQGKWIVGKVPPGVAAPITDAGRLALVYQTRKIIGVALTEGPAFLALIAYMLEGAPAALGLAIALIVGVAARVPQRAQVVQWIEAQLDRLALDRQAV